MPGANADNLLSNGSFESGTFAYGNHGDADVADLPVGSTAITGWTITGGSDVAVLAGGNRFGWTAEDGNISLDLTGYQDAAPYAGVTQSIPTTVGMTYDLSFWLGVSNDNPVAGNGFTGPVSVVASAGSTSSKFTNSIPSSGVQWEQFTLPFVAVSTTTAITLTGAGTAGGELIGLDNVSVTSGPGSGSAPAGYTQNFSSGNPTNYSDYTLVGPGVHTLPPDYGVVSNPALAFTNGYTSYYDHTTGTASGAMLFFDGAADTTMRIWFDNIILTAGTTYRFSYWGSAADDESTPVLVASLNGSALPGTLAVQNGVWSQYTADITVPTTGTYTFAVQDANPELQGNDGALDDISVAPYGLIVTGGNPPHLPPGTGSTVSVVSESGILISAGGKLVVPMAVPHTDRQLLMVTSPGLSIAGSVGNWTGLLDLSNNDMDLPGGNLAVTTDQIRQGYNLVDGGNWNGTGGITSSAAAADTTHLTALGVIQNNQSGSPIYTATNPFDGTTPGACDILVKYTYFGDANLDGKVDGSDYSLIDAGYTADKTTPGSVTGWYNGDFNYDGVIDGSDYALIDNAFNNQTSPINPSALVATDTAEVAGAPVSAVPAAAAAGPAVQVAAVPEPAISLLPAVAALVRRRRAIKS